MKQKITGKHILFMLVGFFAVVFAVNGVFLTAAIKSYPGETERKSYLQGLNYNDTLEQRRLQSELGWSAQIGLTQDAVGAPLLMSRIADKEGQPLSFLSVVATVRSHADDHQIIELPLELRNSGEYAADATSLTQGRWTVLMTATAPDDTTFEAEKTLVVK